jgi:hypothetical protein
MGVHDSGLGADSRALLACCCAGLVVAAAHGADRLVLAREAKTPYVVVRPDQVTDSEELAIKELTTFLNRVTGAVFPVVAEGAFDGTARGIYVGWTKYMASNGVDGGRLGEEEWVVRTVGENLLLTGGRPCGTLYAVYEFLEKQVGCHWLDRNTDVVPAKPTLVLPELQIQGRPTFWAREIYVAYGQATPTAEMAKRQEMFELRNKAVPPRTGSPGRSHTAALYINGDKWFAGHPEYFSLDAQGQRVPALNGSGPGQLCLTHPDVRRIVLEQLRAFIAKDRAEAAETGSLPPRVYDISQEDVYDGHCRCPDCQAIATREGGESGPVIDFINAIAAGIEPDYPDILVQTFAYNLTARPPKTLRPRGNVMVRWCDTYDNGTATSDLVRPLAHPFNAAHHDELAGWGRIATHLAVWDYWITFGYYLFPAPYCMVQCIGPDLRFFAAQHVENLFCESEEEHEPGENFTALKYWLGYQLMVNPYQPEAPLIRTFLDGYYGAAAPQLDAYLTYLQKRIETQADNMRVHAAPHNLRYLDLDFFLTCEMLFDAAEASVTAGSLEGLHAQRERTIVDGALLYLWPWLERRLPTAAHLPFDHEAVVRRYETESRACLRAFYAEGACRAAREAEISRVAALLRDPRLPAPFRDLPARAVADFNRLTFSPYAPCQAFVDDADAAGGMAVCFAGDAEAHNRPLAFGVSGGIDVTLTPETTPQDGKYHLYELGRLSVRPGTLVWAYAPHKLGVTVDRLHVPNADDKTANEWDGYISLKVTGPAYVKGSADSNGVWLDRVLLVQRPHG